jgi:hypothetical protein
MSAEPDPHRPSPLPAAAAGSSHFSAGDVHDGVADFVRNA